MINTHLLLVNPWIADFAAYDLWAKPVGLLYIAKYLRTAGYEVSLLDLLDREKWGQKPTRYAPTGRGKYLKTPFPKPKLLQDITRQYGLYGARPEQLQNHLSATPAPDAILVTSHMTYWYPGIRQTVKLLRKYYPDIPIILGGIYASVYPEHARQVIQPDHLITGYGEKQVLKLLDSLFHKERDYTFLPDFDDSGILPWDLYQNLKGVPLQTSRGCPYQCSYCLTPKLHPRLVQRKTDDVLREIQAVHDQFQIKHIAFYDDALFHAKEKHIIPILEAVRDRPLELNFHTPNGLFAREIDAYLAELMAATGFQTLRLSLESIVPRWQSASSNKVAQQDFISAKRNLNRAGYKSSDIEVYLLMGLPGQKPAEVEASMRFVADQGALSRLASFSPLPGTGEWARAKQLGFVDEGMDPILINSTLYPCRSADFPADKFSQLRQLSNHLNNQVRPQIKTTVPERS